MNEEQWKLTVEQLIAQGVVKTEEEARVRLAQGEKLTLSVQFEPGTFQGWYGTSDI